jgi:acetyl-CoA C-acetyltransferase/acetyl-CoA acyltransferase
MHRSGPLKGLTVLEIAGMGPGPYATMLLADLGAEVVRVDRPGGGQDGVGSAPLDRGRRSVVIDLKRAEGVALLLQMVERADALTAGVYDVVIAAGIESMSHVPTGSSLLGRDPYGPTVTRRYAPGATSQRVAADLMAQRWDIDRAAMDAYAIRSHRRAAAVSAAGEFQREIVPIAVPGSEHAVIHDENVCAAGTLMGIGTMPSRHADPDSRNRHPDVDWAVTAGNSAPAADGASAMLIVSERRARQLNVRPRARFRSFVAVADDPDFVLPGPITATELVLKRSGMDIDQIDHFEINETFAAVPLAWLSAVGANPEFLNPRGGAIALGHPRGASGLRLMTTMLSALEDTGGRFGLQASWEAGGEANATILERI